MNLETIWTAIRSVEKAENLAEWKIADVYLWQVIRERLFTNIAELTGLYQPVPEKPALQFSDQTSFIESPIAIMPFVRRDGNGRDPFTESFIKAAENPLVFGIGQEDEQSDRPQFEQLDAMVLRQFRNRAKLRVAFALSRANDKKWARVISSLETALDIKIDKYRKFPRWLLVDFIAKRSGWKKIFKLAKTELLLIANAWQLGLVAGAKAAGVHVVEIQHGLISAYHPRLSWPDLATSQSVPAAYLADEFWQWGDYWGFASNLPASMRLKTIGAPENIAAAIARNTEKTQQLLVIGQPQVSKNIVEFARFVAAKYSKLQVVLKPHPQELLLTIEELINELGERPANLRVEDPSANTLDLIAKSEYVIGAYSTAMFEAVALGCKVGALKLAGVEHLDGLIASGAVSAIDRVADIENFFVTAKISKNSASYFAKPISAAQLLDSALEELVK